MKLKRFVSAGGALSLTVAAALAQEGSVFAAETISKTPESTKTTEKNCAGKWREGQCGGWAEGRCGGWMVKGSDSSKFPEPNSEGVKTMRHFCMQCHALPNPSYYSGEDWQYVVERMVWRIKDMSSSPKSTLRVPNDKEVATIVDYLKKHGAK